MSYNPGGYGTPPAFPSADPYGTPGGGYNPGYGAPPGPPPSGYGPPQGPPPPHFPGSPSPQFPGQSSYGPPTGPPPPIERASYPGQQYHQQHHQAPHHQGQHHQQGGYPGQYAPPPGPPSFAPPPGPPSFAPPSGPPPFGHSPSYAPRLGLLPCRPRLSNTMARNSRIHAMEWLVRGAAPNDSLFFHYSGHGGQTKDLDGDEGDGEDEGFGYCWLSGDCL
ncbi:hypothetical protein C8F04DRAFT_1259467 [Mycena alexandri]|uniref:Peptidase C14 caspase domain-containing protein n=1 Tax=Mycena alexandri TaxID=1745969 RepID=A0AAD6X3B0_9AGAR|nr:hypothetical protein C8F04DRAFT_1259467 [Mycena alexandri]